MRAAKILALFFVLGCTTERPSPPPEAKRPPESAPATKAEKAPEAPPGPSSKPLRDGTPASGAASAPASAAGAREPLVRDEQDVVVDGVHERWQLRWAAQPSLACLDPIPTCPCAGFAYAEQGQLELVRQIPGKPEERLPLSPLFLDDEGGAAGVAMLQRWDVLPSDSDSDPDEAKIRAMLPSRPEVKVLKVKDYNHDGQASEFVLQVASGPCGHQQAVLVGVEAKGGAAHAFGTAKSSGPLVLEHLSDWEKIAEASSGSVDLVEYPCGDHGSDEEDVLHVKIDGGHFAVERETFACDASGKRGKSTSKETL